MFESQRLWQLIQGYHEPVFVVGGYIRERLLGHQPSDLDVVVTGKAKQLARHVADCFKAPLITLDEQRDIYRVLLPGAFTIDVCQCEAQGIEADLAKRDLTINAMAVSASQLPELAAGEWETVTVIDPHAGQIDLQQGLIRAISRDNLRDDPLRLLRIFRIATHLKFQIEPQTIAWVLELREHLKNVPAERVVNELELLLGSQHLNIYLPEILQLKLLDEVMGWTSDLPNDQQPMSVLIQWLHSCRMDNYQNTGNMASYLRDYMNQSIAGKHTLWITMLLAALCLANHRDGKQIEKWCQNLRLSNRDLALIQMISHGQNLVFTWSAGDYPTRTQQWQLYQLYGEHWPSTVIYSWGLFVANGGTMTAELEQWIIQMLDGYFSKEGLAHLPILLSGHDIMSHLQLKPGPLVGKLMHDIQAAHAEGLVHSREQALQWLAKLNLDE